MKEVVVKLQSVFDLGNSRTKYKIKDLKTKKVERGKQFSTYTTSSRKFDFDKSYTESIQKIDKHIEFSVISPSLDTDRYLIGDGAVDSGLPCNYMVAGDNKVRSAVPYAMTLGLIAKFIAQHYPQQDVKVSVEMAIALPIGQITDTDARLYEENFMQKSHIVELSLGDYSQKVEITFEFVRTVPEGAISIFGLVYDEDGKVKKDSPLVRILENRAQGSNYGLPKDEKSLLSLLMNLRSLHIDIGDGTTELPVTEGVRYLKEFADGFNAGAGYVLQQAEKEFLTAIQVPNAPRQYLSTVIEDPFHRHHGKALTIVKKYIKDQGTNIYNRVIRQLQVTRNEIDLVLVHGGGSCLFKETLEPMLKEALKTREIPLEYVSTELAIWLNVEGMFVFINSPIFKQLKEQHHQLN